MLVASCGFQFLFDRDVLSCKANRGGSCIVDLSLLGWCSGEICFSHGWGPALGMAKGKLFCSCSLWLLLCSSTENISFQLQTSSFVRHQAVCCMFAPFSQGFQGSPCTDEKERYFSSDSTGKPSHPFKGCDFHCFEGNKWNVCTVQFYAELIHYKPTDFSGFVWNSCFTDFGELVCLQLG